MGKKATQENLILNLETRARAASNFNELAFSIANDTHALLPFRQALLFAGDQANSLLHTISGLAKLTENSPYLLWLKRIWAELQIQFDHKPSWVTPQKLENPSAELAEGWQEWWPLGVYAVPVKKRDGTTLGWACFLMDHPPSEALHHSILRIAQTWGYCWEVLGAKPRRTPLSLWRGLGSFKRKLILLLLIACLFIPIRQSVLAPAEIVAMEATVVASPMDGVVKTIHVRPNQEVTTGQVLFSLDDTVLRNRHQVLRQSVAVADAELMAHTQKAFDEPGSKSELALLAGRARERRAELAAVQEQLARINVTAEHDGIAVFADMDDWLGRPVATGERIMQLADPNQPGVLIKVPVADALVLQEGADVKVFLTVKPLEPLNATVAESSYQATLSDEGIASYKLRASLAANDNNSGIRIGLRGTAKVYGEPTMLAYYLFRRPFASLRELTGL